MEGLGFKNKRTVYQVYLDQVCQLKYTSYRGLNDKDLLPYEIIGIKIRVCPSFAIKFDSFINFQIYSPRLILCFNG